MDDVEQRSSAKALYQVSYVWGKMLKTCVFRECRDLVYIVA